MMNIIARFAERSINDFGIIKVEEDDRKKFINDDNDDRSCTERWKNSDRFKDSGMIVLMKGTAKIINLNS